MDNEKFYEKNWFVILLLVVFPIAGLILMWVFKKFHIGVRIGVTVFWLLYWMIAFMVLVVASSSSSEYVNQDNEVAVVKKEKDIKEEEKSENSVKKVEKKTEKKKTKESVEKMRIGDTVDFKGVEVTLNAVRTSNGGDFLKPENDQYVIADVTVSNNTGKEIAVSSIINFKLFDDSSYQYNITLAEDTKGQLDGRVLPGRSLRGELAFDVPSSAKYELVYERVLNSGQAIWHFTP